VALQQSDHLLHRLGRGQLPLASDLLGDHLNLLASAAFRTQVGHFVFGEIDVLL
jgi:hypothetical protein